MNILARRRLILGLALVAGVMLLGQWMMRSRDAVNAPALPEAIGSIESTPADPQPAASADSATNVAPSTPKPAPSFAAAGYVPAQDPRMERTVA